MSADGDLLMVAEMTVRHVMDRIIEPPQTFPGVILSTTTAGVVSFRQDGTAVDQPVTNRLVTAIGDRVLVQFPPSGGAFVLQVIG